ncbi:CRISPR-associated helicase Cas3' [Microbacterium sp.]|uniref:CRISPR-associated helicase Cas3' n=1 Tax=Microbacterium sp. TaxID=51671 RepID=UPI003C76822E
MTTDTPLSAAARVVSAKSYVDPVTGAIEKWLPLHQHLADTAAIAGRLWDQWLAPAVRQLIVDDVGDASAARGLAVWLAGVHDVGKASPAFAVQVPRLAEDMRLLGLDADSRLHGSPDRLPARHELVSHLAASAWLEEAHGFDRVQARRIASILAAHHGKPPDAAQVAEVRPRDRLVGAGRWRDVRVELLEAATSAHVSETDIQRWRAAELTQPTLLLLSAIVIVADWIASSDYFPLSELGEQPWQTTRERAENAWRKLNLPAPWTPTPPTDDAELFRRRFTLGETTTPRPAQAELMRLARESPTPSLFILEAEMGAGKTEAALAAAEILASRFGRSGVFIGLPTQATADGMFARLTEWTQRLELDTPVNVFLAHGNRLLNEGFDRLARDGRFRAIGDTYDGRRDASEDLVIAHQWFSAPKRGPLSSLVVGTIDQALFGALRTRHVMLRHLALAGKVVILDEVHAYDAYMGQYLERALHWLGAYGVPVILLSATLPSDKRRAFAKAYESGRTGGTAPSAPRRAWVARSTASSQPDPHESLNGDIGYPSIVAVRGGSPPLLVHPASTGTSRVVALDRVDDELDSLAGLLSDALAEGGTAVVIRNTVRRAQETAARLREEFGQDAVMLAHARFLGVDRARRDRRLLELFGKNGDRPEKMIVVATQVVEQSLDLDFDIMVSDVAPVDLLLQRAGRLHRHAGRSRPSRVDTPRLVLTGADWTCSPPEPNPASQKIYERHPLLRTLAVLHGCDALRLPDDIPPLVQAVYGQEPLGPAEWADPMSEAAASFQNVTVSRQHAADQFRLNAMKRTGDLLGLIGFDAGDPESGAGARATVRDGEDTLDVLALQQNGDGGYYTPFWLEEGGGIQIPENDLPDHALTRVILGCSLRLPAAVCRGRLIDRHIRRLEESYPVLTWHGSHALRGELVLVLDADGRASLDPFTLSYSPEDGLSYTWAVRDALPESELPV